ncbi:SMC-Scp complex subunit ScpB [bacterium]|jgi:segregation and condensation protein B|nr:SMC-Scp complex subunit ScpB [bacterium]MBT4121763.1 SMC-Scp complex subunit ScpB [bacterium]MBT4334874.1 SMC-Scp complex subunit ScpB [bacterium]MBT4495175.1 SMC-Scp complex subunit ScpB [bacterium]MBT4763970.1 SMC-Scp complex subunit ScpB [bacterium]
MKLKSQIESILLVSSRPLTITKLVEHVKVKKDKVMNILNELNEEYTEGGRGIRLIINNNKVQLVSAPENTDLVQGYLKSDLTGELTKPSLETLTIIAYRQPVTKAEMEQIRGVNCSLILRNLMIRGLVEADYNKERGVTEYNVTLDFLKFLGINSIKELPDYEKLNSDENLLKLLDQDQEQTQVISEEVVKVEVKEK